MYKIMIVEDSKPIMRNIIRQIKAIDSRLSIVETAYDGGEALSKLKNTPVDILLTDIRMPVMDGLSLLEAAKKLYPSLQCVIISGYNDFEYARQAIKLQVKEYILKPVMIEELRRVITNMLEIIDSERYQNIEKHLEIYITNKISGFKGCDFSFKNYIIALVRFGLTRRSFEHVDKEIISSTLSEAGCSGDYWVIDTGYFSESIILFDAMKYKENDVISKMNYLLKALYREFKMINILISNPLQDLIKLSSQYNDISNILSIIIIIGDSKVFSQNSLDNNYFNLLKLNEEALLFEKKFRYIIENKQLKTFKTELQKYVYDWSQNKCPAVYIRRFITIIIDLLCKTYNSSDLTFDTSYAVDQLLNNCFSNMDIYSKVLEYYESFINNRLDSQNSSTEELLNRIIGFIKANIYGSISLQDIANKFNLSTSYISRLMKLKFKESPMDYYISLKIEEAKAQIQSNKEVHIKDISDSLGFSDQHYFSKVFRARVGVSPTEYKTKVNEINK